MTSSQYRSVEAVIHLHCATHLLCVRLQIHPGPRQLQHVKGDFCYCIALHSWDPPSRRACFIYFFYKHRPTDNTSPDKYVYSQANIIFVILSILSCEGWMDILLRNSISLSLSFFFFPSQPKGVRKKKQHRDIKGEYTTVRRER